MSTSTRVLSYLDEVSSVSLQLYNLLVHDIARSEGLTALTDEWLRERMASEWSATADGPLHWEYATGTVPPDPTLGDAAYSGTCSRVSSERETSACAPAWAVLVCTAIGCLMRTCGRVGRRAG